MRRQLSSPGCATSNLPHNVCKGHPSARIELVQANQNSRLLVLRQRRELINRLNGIAPGWKITQLLWDTVSVPVDYSWLHLSNLSLENSRPAQQVYIMLYEGQDEGAMMLGLGLTLYEEAAPASRP